jgi:hypothetical protein
MQEYAAHRVVVWHLSSDEVRHVRAAEQNVAPDGASRRKHKHAGHQVRLRGRHDAHVHSPTRAPDGGQVDCPVQVVVRDDRRGERAVAEPEARCCAALGVVLVVAEGLHCG